MKEITSAYQDLEKRMAIFAGLGAVIFISLFNVVTQADLTAFLVRGLVAFLIFALGGYFWGGYLAGLIAKEPTAVVPPAEGVEVTRTDVKQAEEPAAAEPVHEPAQAAEHAAEPEPGKGGAVDFTLPEMDPLAGAEPKQSRY